MRTRAQARRTRILGAIMGVAASAFLIPQPSRADSDLTYLAHAPTVKSTHPPLIILLHGSGADERDMISMWSQLPAEFVVVSPRAPFRDAGGGYRWYRRDPKERESDIALSRKIIDVMVQQSIEHFDADPKRVFLAGFSQGAVMTYEVALREPGRFRGAGILSGSMFASGQAALSRTTDWTHESVFIGHGTADERIPFGSATSARDTLERLGVPIEFHAYQGMRHGTGDAEIKDFSAWLGKRLADGSASSAR